jgi:DNA-binding NtrC family response regulator
MRRRRTDEASQPAAEPPLLIGRSAAIRRLLDLIDRVAPTDATVLITGERGTGKELIARSIQRASRWRDRPFVIVNCAALPPELLATELFGHERGAFTGALDRRAGLLAAADGGTLFLDEVGDLSLAGQAMLLRFLQERELRPLGGVRTVHVDVRVIAATNKDLERTIEGGQFRADLYDRLSEIVLRAPALRDRREDIPMLIEHFMAMHSRRHGVATPDVAPAARRALQVHTWPGNVRQLEKVISRAVVLGADGCITAFDFDVSADDRPTGPALLTERQREALRMAGVLGVVCRADLKARFGISGEAARRDLSSLVKAGYLRQSGRRRGSRYSPV